MSDDLIDWFEEADGFCGGTRAPHKWVLQAHSEIILLRARLAEVEKERDALAAAKWIVRHIDTINDMALMSLARDEEKARVKLLETRKKEAVETLRKGFKSCDPTKTAAAIILAIAQLEGHGE
jgi:hypothetical protein